MHTELDERSIVTSRINNDFPTEKAFLIKKFVMRQIHVEMHGDISYCVPDGEINTVIEQFTSESNEMVNVWIKLGPFTEEMPIITIFSENEAAIVVFRRNFCAVFPEDTLNIRQLIYLIDNPPISVEQFLREIDF